MDRDQLLAELSMRVESGDLTRAEVLAAIGPATEQSQVSASRLGDKLASVLYFIGGAVVFFGIVFLIAQEWSHFGSSMKIFVTLGASIAAFVVGVLFSQQQQLGAAGSAFFLISALLMPVGLFVTYDEAGIDVTRLVQLVQITGILFTTYIGVYWLFRQNVLLVFTFIFGSWFFFVVTDYMIGGSPTIDQWTVTNYRILFAGLAFMSLGFGFTGTQRQPLTSWLYAVGVFGFLGAGLALGEWKPDQNVFWEALYPGLVFGVIFLSTYLKSRIFLVFGSIALGLYLTKITAQYFSDSLGWAFSLVLLGFLLMGVAYLAIRFNRKHVSN
jgi:hypothetical protein